MGVILTFPLQGADSLACVTRCLDAYPTDALAQPGERCFG